MRLFGFQFDITWEDKAANFAKVRDLVRRANPPAGSLLALPEMFATGFSMNAHSIAESCGGPTDEVLVSLARERACWVMGGTAMRGTDGFARNMCLVFSPTGQLAASYAKMRPFTPGGEREHYAAGEQICAFEWEGCTTTPFVCYDLRFPELFREAAFNCRPHLYVVIASWPSKRAGHWAALLKARAIENQAFVAGINRIGADPFNEYSGRSLIADPHGEIIADAGETEGSISAEVDLGLLRNYREGLPFLEDMRRA